jgi:hypothetical protein
VPQISDRSYLRGGSGICALEAYHAGAIRMQLLQNSSAIIQPWGVDALTITQVPLDWLPDEPYRQRNLSALVVWQSKTKYQQGLTGYIWSRGILFAVRSI